MNASYTVIKTVCFTLTETATVLLVTVSFIVDKGFIPLSTIKGLILAVYKISFCYFL